MSVFHRFSTAAASFSPLLSSRSAFVGVGLGRTLSTSTKNSDPSHHSSSPACSHQHLNHHHHHHHPHQTPTLTSNSSTPSSSFISSFPSILSSRSFASSSSVSSPRRSSSSSVNRGVVYQGPRQVSVESIPFPTFTSPVDGSDIHHGVILKVVATCVCGSDQHMVRNRTTAPKGLVLGHEITGEVIEKGKDVLNIQVGDIVSVPFNVACGRCRNCKEGKTGICLNVNTSRPGGAYGYVDMGGWIGGQSEYVMIPYADWNLLKFPASKDRVMHKIKDLALLADILPTGFHGAVTAGVGVGSTVYVAGAGPVGLAAAVSAQLLGSAVVIVGDLIPARLAQARSFGCETLDLAKISSDGIPDALQRILGVPEVDCAIDAVGFEARGCGHHHNEERPAEVLNTAMKITRAGGSIGIPGLYVTDDPGAKTEAAKKGNLSLRLGEGWAKSISFATGQCPVMKYHRGLMKLILHDRLNIAAAVNAVSLPLEKAKEGYENFDSGASVKYILDPHGEIEKHHKQK